MSPISEARKKANDKYIKEKTDEIKIRVPKGKKVDLQEHAKNRGESLNSFVNRAIDETVERDIIEYEALEAWEKERQAQSDIKDGEVVDD